MLWDDIFQPKPGDSRKYFRRHINGKYYKIKRDQAADGKVKKVDIWRRRDRTPDDKLRNKVFDKGQASPRYQLKPGYRDYAHWSFRPGTAGLDPQLKDPSKFFGMNGGKWHRNDGRQAPSGVIKNALRGKTSRKYFRKG